MNFGGRFLTIMMPRDEGPKASSRVEKGSEAVDMLVE